MRKAILLSLALVVAVAGRDAAGTHQAIVSEDTTSAAFDKHLAAGHGPCGPDTDVCRWGPDGYWRLLGYCVNETVTVQEMPFIGPNLTMAGCYSGPMNDAGYILRNPDPTSDVDCLSWSLNGVTNEFELTWGGRTRTFGPNWYNNPSWVFPETYTVYSDAKMPGMFVDDDGDHHHVAVTVKFTPEEHCDCHPDWIEFKVTEKTCADSTQGQSGKLTCKEFPGDGSNLVDISIPGAVLDPPGPYAIGDQFRLVAQSAFVPEISRFQLSGMINQTIALRTSCSSFLFECDCFGALEVVNWHCNDSAAGINYGQPPAPGKPLPQHRHVDLPDWCYGKLDVSFYQDGELIFDIKNLVGEPPYSCVDGGAILGEGLDGDVNKIDLYNHWKTPEQILELSEETNCYCTESPTPSVSASPTASPSPSQSVAFHIEAPFLDFADACAGAQCTGVNNTAVAFESTFTRKIGIRVDIVFSGLLLMGQNPFTFCDIISAGNCFRYVMDQYAAEVMGSFNAADVRILVVDTVYPVAPFPRIPFAAFGPGVFPNALDSESRFAAQYDCTDYGTIPFIVAWKPPPMSICWFDVVFSITICVDTERDGKAPPLSAPPGWMIGGQQFVNAADGLPIDPVEPLFWNQVNCQFTPPASP